jgi:hypothetical protein
MKMLKIEPPPPMRTFIELCEMLEMPTARRWYCPDRAVMTVADNEVRWFAHRISDLGYAVSEPIMLPPEK